jgi:hypothetical protein
MVQVWDVATGTALSSPMAHGGQVVRAEFSQDLRTVTTITRPNSRRQWEVESGLPITIPPRYPLYWRSESAIALSGSEKLRGKEENALQTDSWPISDLILLIQLYSGRKIDGASGVVPLDLSHLENAWKTLKNKYPAEFWARSALPAPAIQ